MKSSKGTRKQAEPLAIVGIGCRFPGGIVDPQSFWNFLCAGGDAITEVPADRWDVNHFYDPDRENQGKVYTKKGGFLINVGLFNPEFFGISPKEAEYIDPQQRLLLEVTWEALEDGGMAPEKLAGSKTGVFVGLFMHDYENIHSSITERTLLGPHSATGMSATITSNRISYVFDFKGPSMTIDTACSSSLVAVHLACQSLLSSETDLALAGGVNVLIKPEMTMVLCKGMFLSRDGYCRSFDERADGYVRSEGAAMIAIKRLADALENGNPIYALIRSTAVNQDGQSDGLTVPSVDSQIMLVRDVLSNAGIAPEDVQYVEAHGTGTPVGDPIEAAALGTVLSKHRPKDERLIIGSVKSNIGHTESVAGAAGLIKAALMLKNGMIPPNLHFEKPNPQIPFEELRLQVPTALEQWPDRDGKPRIAGVNSFGFGGTNAHTILEAYETTRHGCPAEKRQAFTSDAESPSLLPLSARTFEDLRAVASSIVDFLREEQVSLEDIGHTLALRKGHHPCRLAVVAYSQQDFAEKLQAYLNGEKSTGIVTGQADQNNALKSLPETSRKGLMLKSSPRTDLEDISMLNTLGQLYTSGYPVDWNAFYRNGRFVRLPSYPWQRQYYWKESEASKQTRVEPLTYQGTTVVGKPTHPLLGTRLDGAVAEWRGKLDINNLTWLADHVVQGSTVYPGAAYGEMALAAHREVSGDSPAVVRELEIKAPLILEEDYSTTVQLVVENGKSFSIYGRTGAQESAQWILHARGRFDNVVNNRTPAQINLKEIKKRCGEMIDKNLVYRRFRTYGLEYGPDFQNVGKVWTCAHEALGRIKLKDSINKTLEQYLLHPAVLDACLQVMASIQSEEGTYLPVRIDAITLYGKPYAKMWCHSHLTDQASGFVRGDMTLCDNEGTVIAEVKGLKCQLVKGTASGDAINDLLYEYNWIRKDHSGLQFILDDSHCLSSVNDLLSWLKPRAESLSHRYDRKRHYKDVRPRLDELSRLYISQAFRCLGWNFTDETQLTSGKLDVIPKYLRFLHRMLEILEQDGLARKKATGWQMAYRSQHTPPRELWNRLVFEYPDYLAELILLDRCGSRLKEVLRGEEDPLAFLFPQSSATIEHLYQGSPTCRMYNSLAQYIVEHIAVNMAGGHVLRILEVGAGTGSLTSSILSVLQSIVTRYMFTDISPSFVAAAESKFRGYDFVEYKTLDIEKDPVFQGFGQNSCDIVLASNVLNATADLKNALSNIQQLLAPDGILVLIEPTHPPLWHDLVFGLLQGWWLFVDSYLRPSHPLLSRRAWLSLLEKMDFDAASLHENEGGSEPEMSVIVAQSNKTRKNVNLAPHIQTQTHHQGDEDKRWFILADEHSIADQLVEILSRQGIAPVVISKGHTFAIQDENHLTIRPNEPEDFEQILDAAYGVGISPVVVDMWELTQISESITCETLQKKTNLLCMHLVHIMQSLAKKDWKQPPMLWIVTNGVHTVGDVCDVSPAQSPLWGLGRVAVNEFGSLQTRMVDLGPVPVVEELEQFAAEIVSPDTEDEIALRVGKRYVNRLMRRKPVMLYNKPDVSYYVQWLPGSGFDGFTFKKQPFLKPGRGKVALEVRAAGINFKEVARVAGLLDNSYFATDGMSDDLGLECSGVVTAVGEGVESFEVGDEVMGPVLNCYASRVIADSRVLVHKPTAMSFEQAATVPLAFLASWYALHELAGIKKGERVLIHTATGGVGLAAIQIAKAAGAEVLTTAGTPEKREFLKSLGISYVGDSRNTKFAKEIMDVIGNESIDIILNTLPGESIEASMSILKPIAGRFIDLSNIYDRSFPIYRPEKGISVFTFELIKVIKTYPDRAGTLMREILKGFEGGDFHALPYRAFPIARIADAFKHMRRGVHIGKNVLSMEGDGVVPEPEDDKMRVHSEATYLITGGLGGFGRAVAQWLVACGVRHLVLAGRSGASTPEARDAVRQMEQTGARVVVSRTDVTQQNQVQQMLDDIKTNMPPLKGIIHAVMVLEDTPLSAMTDSQLKIAMDPKILGSWNLHTLTHDTDLDFFILFSSFAAIVGNPEQANYAAGNIFLDMLACYRKAQGLPVLSIGWGPIRDAGYVAQHENMRKLFSRQGIGQIGLRQAWKVIVHALQQNLTNVGVIPSDWDVFKRYSLAVSKSPRFSHLVRSSTHTKAVTEPGQIDILTKAATPEEKRQILTEILSKEVASTLGISLSKLSSDKALNSLGFDSLMAVELMERIQKVTGLNTTKMKLFRPGITVDGLVDITSKELFL